MPSLFENAVASIRMGVEDFLQQDADRDISAVRNFYSGILLLAKEAIIRQAPNADPAVVIGAKAKPLPDGNGGVQFEKVGKTTIDFMQVVERAKDFGIQIDRKALERINGIRNDMEHHFTAEAPPAIREAISKGFPVVASLFRQMAEDPVPLLGDAWEHMLLTKAVYDQEVADARQTYENVGWHSHHMSGVALRCPDCRSEFLSQKDRHNDHQDGMELVCRQCGIEPDVEATIEFIIEDIHGGDAYMRVKDGDGEGPIFECPSCQRETLLEFDNECANCGDVLDYEAECARCSNGISLSDYLSGSDEGLCSYCAYVSDKVMRE